MECCCYLRNIQDLVCDGKTPYGRRFGVVQFGPMANEVSTLMSGEKFTFPIAHGKVKLSGGDRVLLTSTLIWDHPDRGEEQGNLQGKSDESSSAPLRDSSWYDGEKE